MESGDEGSEESAAAAEASGRWGTGTLEGSHGGESPVSAGGAPEGESPARGERGASGE